VHGTIRPPKQPNLLLLLEFDILAVHICQLTDNPAYLIKLLLLGKYCELLTLIIINFYNWLKFGVSRIRFKKDLCRRFGALNLEVDGYHDVVSQMNGDVFFLVVA